MESLKNIFENTFKTQFQICRKEKKFKLGLNSVFSDCQGGKMSAILVQF